MKKLDYTTIANVLILAVFTLWFLIKGNYEFLLYTVTIGLLIWIIAKTDKIFSYTSIAKWGFVVWLFAHFSGGAFYFSGVRLYDIVLIPLMGDPFFILRYDQLMHIFSYVVLTSFAYSMIVNFADKKAKLYLIAITAFLAGMGISALNEVIEFSTVVFFNSTGVGNYYNNALDLVFNAIGAAIAVLFMHKNNKK
tara:strand:+ start:401 stop:982 length:582 start_codon:yes stop_codon:yes gene_type:complete